MARTVLRAATEKMPTSATFARPGAALPPARKRHGGSRPPSGFTLIEILVVLSIALLVIGVLPFAAGRLHEAAEYRSTVRTMLSEMTRARQRAAVEGRSVAFSVDLDARRFGTDGAINISIPADLAVRATIAGQELGADSVASIRFFPDGGATGGAIDIIRPAGGGVRLSADWLFGRISQDALPL